MARAAFRSLLIAVCAAAAPALAQTVATSPAPESIGVTIYRAPGRSAGEAMQLSWLNGYALITETRRVSIPQGEGTIRFEGVAGGIMPESAIVTGLPDGVAEKNQDAWLLSPASLLDRSLGRRVHLRRTSPGGAVREHEAVIRSGADGAVVLQTEEGFEALRCTGFNETIVYPSVPEGLSAKPTLSVRTRSDRAATATVTLSYLATGFDWEANYVATLAPTEDRLDLFAWVTLANGDVTSFPNASTQTVAGRVNREHYEPGIRPRGEELQLRCWPAGSTSDPTYGESRSGAFPPPPPPPPPPAPVALMSSEQIVVTGTRVRKAVLEELGGLKLYRIPDPVTVAAKSQKQVALLEKEGVKAQIRYRHSVAAGQPEGTERTRRVLTMRNRAAEGLGLPLPAGRLVLFAEGMARPILLGEGFVDDRAVGEEVEIELGPATGVQAQAVVQASARGRSNVEYVVTNDRSVPVKFELELHENDVRLKSAPKLARRDGNFLWEVTVPANGSATLRYSFSPRR